MSVAAVIKALHGASIQPTGREIAEALWLAQYLAAPVRADDGLSTAGTADAGDAQAGGLAAESPPSPAGRVSLSAAEETGREMNLAIVEGARENLGMGEALGRHLVKIAKPEFAPHSILHGAYQASIPVTVHVAVGTDTPHTHPQADGASIGAATHRDFRLLCSLVTGLDRGGVYLNIGSAVVLPEVFLKAVSVVRNLGHPLAEFTTVNFDFLQHYRPKMNVVERPHAGSGGRGFSITGHHELMIPLLAAALVESER